MWGVAQLLPNQIHIAEANLQRQSFTTFFPVFETEKLHRHKLISVREPLFPGYLFIEIQQDQRWAPINSTYGISRLLTRQPPDSEYRAPCEIPSTFIDGLRRCCCHAAEKKEWRLTPGTQVRIASGPFAGFTGMITAWSGTDRVKLVAWLLNRDLTVEVFGGDVVAVETAVSPETPVDTTVPVP